MSKIKKVSSEVKVQKVKRFVLSKKNVQETDLVLEFTTKEGKVLKYSPSKVYTQLKDKFEAMNCWHKYGNYTNTNNLPKFVRELDNII
tara:strand:- start:521 stop:784 length:264 start_codon:yes stop_codon:yes gene_type:complete